MSVQDSDSLAPGDIFEILSNHRRRMVLYYLRKNKGVADVKELAEEIAAMENDVPTSDLSSQQRKRVYVSLYQTHLPKMTQMNAIEYDKDAGTVRLTDQTTDIDRYLSGGDQSPYPWRFHYGILAVISAILVGLAVTNAPLFASVSPLWIAIGVVALFGISAVVQFVIRTREEQIPFELSEYDG